jgi:hypothetical protein
MDQQKTNSTKRANKDDYMGKALHQKTKSTVVGRIAKMPFLENNFRYFPGL